MLPQTKTTQRASATGLLSGRTSARGPRRISNFEKKRIRNAQQSTYFQYTLYAALALFACILLSLAIFYLSNTSTSAPASFDANEISDLVDDLKSKSATPKQPKQKTPANANAVKVTFSIYTNANCDATDPSQTRSISMHSSDVSADSMGSECPLCFAFCGQNIGEMEANQHIQSIQVSRKTF